ncbi:hypothetical protein A1O1_03204 [Capronia coronata CBS 617.96]|uniref:DUF7730 domain-containing protein n=1 Tax=Capronia coronata CBS 617.96 TaxID=1182541 RepID=W9YZS5_9EURO|nr:uncharacterized protein A1O1_03204 [Capronia coronata CBS 617.96]EXJ94806.1 hypothetical protein A1O1_03204 [Capronia coronata CBS 617.96]
MRLTRKLVERKKGSVAADAESEPQSSPFLKVGAEIRLLVYKLLENLPDHDGDTDRQQTKQYDGFSKTRKSLLLTCRQINVEFTPHFYRSTTFSLRYQNHTPNEFYKLLRTMHPAKVGNIRHLEYRNRQYRPTDFAVLEDMPQLLARAGLHLETFNVVHGDYVSSSILRAPLAMAILVLDLDRPMPSPDMSWTTFDHSAWGSVARPSYAVKFRIFEHEVTYELMRDAAIRREHGPSGFRILFRRKRGVADYLAVHPPVRPKVVFVDDGPTLAGVLWPLVPRRPDPVVGEDGKPVARRRQLRLD